MLLGAFELSSEVVFGVATLLIQTGGFVWHLSNLNTSVKELSRKVTKLGSTDRRLVRIETLMELPPLIEDDDVDS